MFGGVSSLEELLVELIKNLSRCDTMKMLKRCTNYQICTFGYFSCHRILFLHPSCTSNLWQASKYLPKPLVPTLKCTKTSTECAIPPKAMHLPRTGSCMCIHSIRVFPTRLPGGASCRNNYHKGTPLKTMKLEP